MQIRVASGSNCTIYSRPRNGVSPTGRRVMREVNMTAVAGDLFPPAPRVLYRKAPLVQVTCQLRFPALLRLESDLPADFQELIRGYFPLLERQTQIPLPLQLPPEVAEAFRAQAGLSGWRFLTEDKKTTLALSSDLLAFRYHELHNMAGFFGPMASGVLGARIYLRSKLFFTRRSSLSGFDSPRKPWPDFNAMVASPPQGNVG